MVFLHVFIKVVEINGHLSPPQYLVLVSLSPTHGELHAELPVSRAQAATLSTYDSTFISALIIVWGREALYFIDIYHDMT